MASTTATMVLCLLSVFPAAVVAFGPSPPNPPNPYNCTKSGCWFSYTNPASLGKPPPNQGRCGEVDAAPRMPPDIWRDQVSVSLYQQLYGHADQELFSFFIGHYGAPLRLVLPYDWGNEAPCYQRPFEMTHYCPTSC